MDQFFTMNTIQQVTRGMIDSQVNLVIKKMHLKIIFSVSVLKAEKSPIFSIPVVKLKASFTIVSIAIKFTITFKSNDMCHCVLAI